MMNRLSQLTVPLTTYADGRQACRKRSAGRHMDTPAKDKVKIKMIHTGQENPPHGKGGSGMSTSLPSICDISPVFAASISRLLLLGIRSKFISLIHVSSPEFIILIHVQYPYNIFPIMFCKELNCNKESVQRHAPRTIQTMVCLLDEKKKTLTSRKYSHGPKP